MGCGLREYGRLFILILWRNASTPPTVGAPPGESRNRWATGDSAKQRRLKKFIIIVLPHRILPAKTTDSRFD